VYKTIVYFLINYPIQTINATYVLWFYKRKNLSSIEEYVFEVILLEVSLLIDGKAIELNDFSKDFLGGTIQGAISPLRGIDSNWKQLEIKVKR
jgi:hypothetical protein